MLNTSRHTATLISLIFDVPTVCTDSKFSNLHVRMNALILAVVALHGCTVWSETISSTVDNEFEGRTVNCSVSDDTCTIIGYGDSSFKDATIICSYHSTSTCNITCIGTNSCQNTTIIASNTSNSVTVSCRQDNTCSFISINVNDASFVDINCQGINACQDASLSASGIGNAELWCLTNDSCSQIGLLLISFFMFVIMSMSDW